MTPAEIAFLAALCMAPQAPGENPVPVIQQLESGGENVKNFRWDARHTASSEGQITNSTWNSLVAPKTGFPIVGPGTPYPQGVMDLDEFQRKIGIAVLYDTAEFKHWICEDCNAELRELVKTRGADAFKAAGTLTDNPCALAQYIDEKPAGVQRPSGAKKPAPRGPSNPIATKTSERPTAVATEASPNWNIFGGAGGSSSSFVVTPKGQGQTP